MLDETRFLSDHGIRSLSKLHEREPYVLEIAGEKYQIDYEPGESRTSLFGGNSNWRGPVWFPINFLIIESMQRFHHYYGDDFKIEYPVGSGEMVTIQEASRELAERLMRLFTLDENGRRAAVGENDKMQTDPHFQNLIPFNEYFHGDTGRGCGAGRPLADLAWNRLMAHIHNTLHPPC